MSGYVDLHVHSHYSDGVDSPERVVTLAHEAGLAAMALADHDNIDGIDEAMEAGARLGIEVLSATELSVVHGKVEDIHLLGYGFDHHDPVFASALAEFREYREGRSEQIVARINERLVSEGRAPISFEEVRESAGGTVGRPHIARALLAGGHVRGNDDAFQRYLVPCNVPKRFFPIDEAIAMIHAAGGVAVLAHPPFITRDRRKLLELVDAFVAFGLDGIEAYNTGASNDEIDWTITIARHRGLIVTGGSDYHGIPDSGISVGNGRGNLRIPYGCVDEIRSAMARHAQG